MKKDQNMIFEEKEERNYLFIDAGYIKKCLEKFKNAYFKNSNIYINYEKIALGFEKIFYYDCPVYKKDDEKEDDFKNRKSIQ